MIRHILLISAALQKWKHKAKTWLPRIETTPRTLEVLTQCFVNTYWCNNIHSVIDTELERKQITTDFYLHSMVAHITLPPPALIKKKQNKNYNTNRGKTESKRKIIHQIRLFVYTKCVLFQKNQLASCYYDWWKESDSSVYLYYFVKSLIPWLL